MTEEVGAQVPEETSPVAVLVQKDPPVSVTASLPVIVYCPEYAA